MSEAIEFVFSFRSPYAWIAAHHVLPQVHRDIEVRWVPFYPLPTFPNFGGELVPAKYRHNVQDIIRLCRAYGLKVRKPPEDEANWPLSHAAFLAAERAGKGPEFGLALFDVRWSQGRECSTPEAVREAAEAAGLDPQKILAEAESPERQEELRALVQRNFDERDLFGVPMFVLATGDVFWGQDRMDWALRHGYVRSAEAG